jgi:hypothetical protein
MENMDNYLILQRFFSANDAKPCIDVLQTNHIRFKIEDGAGLFDPSMAFNKHENRIEIQVHTDDFIKANMLLENETEIDFDMVEKDHYLFDFSDTELTEVTQKIEEWSVYDRVLARQILKNRGVNSGVVDMQTHIKMLKDRKTEALKNTPDKMGVITESVDSIQEKLDQFLHETDPKTKKQHLVSLIIKITIATTILVFFILYRMRDLF